jgi:hypothetical protein
MVKQLKKHPTKSTGTRPVAYSGRIGGADRCGELEGQRLHLTVTSRGADLRTSAMNPSRGGGASHDLVVGELGKTLSPSKCQIIKIHEVGSRNIYGKKVQIYEKKVK